jgi:putative tricarboxylic transport membrane protein
MRRSNLLVSLILVGLSGIILVEASKLTFGSIRTPQTAFFPAILAFLLLLFSLVLLSQVFGQPDAANRDQAITAEGWTRIGATLGTLIGFALVLERLGFLLSTFLLMILLLRAIEPQKWSVVIIVALSTSLVSYFIFAWLLNIPLPTGPLGI